MRIVPLITACLVAAVLFGLVIERERFFALLSDLSPREVADAPSEEVAAAPEAEATMAYTRYVLEKGLAGDLLDLQVALAPCIVGYAEIGGALAGDAATRLDGNPYRAWIEMYAAADYQAVAAAHVVHMDRLMDRRGGPGRLESLATTFRQATRLEAAFWQMGLHPPA